MEDPINAADTLVEEREEVMIPAKVGTSTTRKAHFLKPILAEDTFHLPPPPYSMLASKPTFKNLEKFTLLSYKAYPSQKWKFWVQSLKPKYQETWKKVGIYEAILASTYKIPKDKNSVIWVAERWCSETNSFVFPWGEVTITLEDVIYLGCFDVLGASFLSPLDDDGISICNSLENVQKNIRLGCGSVSLSAWMEYFTRSDQDFEHEAFLAMWLSRYVLVRPQNYITKQAFRVAIHLAQGNKIALAPVVLASIYRDLRLLHNSVVESIKSGSTVGLRFMSRHYDLVQMWVWERFAELRPVPNVVERGEPRSARWKRVTKLKVNDVRTALDSAGLSFMWRPYATTSSNSMLSNLYEDNEQWVVVDSDAVESFARCLRTSVLVGLESTEQYLPHRVAMQFGLDQDVPSPIVQSNESPDTAWSSYNRPLRGVKLYIPPRLYESAVSSRYVVWWRGLVVVNNMELATNSIQNKRHSPPVSCVQKRDLKSLATPGSLSGCLEERPKNYAAKDGLTSAQLMSQSGKIDSSGNIIDLDDRSILNDCDNVVKDSLTIAQHLNQSRERDTSENARDDDELVPNILPPGLFSICNENPEELHCTSEPMELTEEIMTSSDKCDKIKLSIEEQAEPKEDVVVRRNLEFTNEPAEIRVHSMSSSDKSKKSKSSTERPTEPEEDAVVSPEHSIINIEEESCDCEETKSELRHLGLKARIWRLETILDMIKAEKIASSSRGNLEK